jgi:hypothetical protein
MFSNRHGVPQRLEAAFSLACVARLEVVPFPSDIAQIVLLIILKAGCRHVQNTQCVGFCVINLKIHP